MLPYALFRLKPVYLSSIMLVAVLGNDCHSHKSILARVAACS